MFKRVFQFANTYYVLRAYKVQPKAGTIIDVNAILERESNLYMRSVINSVDRKKKDIQLISAKGNIVDSINSLNKLNSFFSISI